MFKKSSKKSKSATLSLNGMCQTCSISFVLMALLGVIAVIAAVIGVYKAHFLSTGLVFGHLNGSASLIALTLTLMFARKISKSCSCQCALPSKK